MKNIIVTVGEILLGVVIFGLIFGTTGSIRAEAGTIFTNVITQLGTVRP